MPWIMQMVGFALLLLGIGFALWISLWLLVFFFAVGVLAVIYLNVREFLVSKGILNPTPGIAPEQPEHITIVEGDYTRVENQTTHIE